MGKSTEQKQEAIKPAKGMQILLYDLDSDGLASCSNDNWTGTVYRIPRIRYNDARSLPDIDESGMYILFGFRPTEQQFAYVGKASLDKAAKA